MILRDPTLDTAALGLETVFEAGSVWLAGAGPGDPGLLTLTALSGLRQADIVVHDALVDPRILAMADKAAVLEYVGKRGGAPSARQPDITRRLIELAQAGHRVLRLKGGDPFVFGRGGEEALGLVEAGIPFRVVPGVTAGVAAPAYAGIPVTHREDNHAFIVATGSSCAEGADWRALGAIGHPLILYMAWRMLPFIAGELQAGGRASDTPVAIVSEATTARQQVLRTTLERCAEDAAASTLGPPAIIVIGSNVRLRDALDWLGEAKP